MERAMRAVFLGPTKRTFHAAVEYGFYLVFCFLKHKEIKL